MKNNTQDDLEENKRIEKMFEEMHEEIKNESNSSACKFFENRIKKGLGVGLDENNNLVYQSEINQMKSK